MSENAIAIKVQGVRKRYRLGVVNGSTLREDLQSWWAKVRGKENPNSKINADERLIGQEFWALNGIDLTVYQGERLGIIGSNGAGKSTLLKLLSRVTAPTEGDIDLWGRVSSMLEIGTGFHPELTGRENIYMNGTMLGMSRSEIDRKMEQIIEFSEIREFIDTPVKRYSSGMFVKLAFAVVANLNSEIMIMDEVLAVGDMAFQNKCLDRMRQAADDENRTVLYVSHNMATIRRLCSRCIVLDHGRIIFDGDVEKAIALYMDRGLGGSQVDITLSEDGQEQTALNHGLHLRRVQIPDKLTPTFGPNEDLKVDITVDVDYPAEDLMLRLVAVNDSDIPMVTSRTKAFSFPEAGTYTLQVTAPLSLYKRGTFYTNLALVRQDEIGFDQVLDAAEHAFRFELTGSSAWQPAVHGYFDFPESNVIVTKKEN